MFIFIHKQYIMEEFLGSIKQYAYFRADFIRNGFTGYLPCDGRLLNINAYTALFSLLGTTYGGNGITNFQLPNLLPKDEKGEILDIKAGEIHNGVPYIPYYICVEGLYPSGY